MAGKQDQSLAERIWFKGTQAVDSHPALCPPRSHQAWEGFSEVALTVTTCPWPASSPICSPGFPGACSSRPVISGSLQGGLLVFIKEPTNLSYLVASSCPLAPAFWMSTICEVTQGSLTTSRLPHHVPAARALRGAPIPAETWVLPLDTPQSLSSISIPADFKASKLY